MSTSNPVRRPRSAWRSSIAATVVAVLAIVVAAPVAAAEPDLADQVIRPASAEQIASTRLLVTYDEPAAELVIPAGVTDGQVIGAGAQPSAVQVLEFDTVEQAQQAGARLRARPDVRTVEPDRVRQIVAPSDGPGSTSERRRSTRSRRDATWSWRWWTPASTGGTRCSTAGCGSTPGSRRTAATVTATATSTTSWAGTSSTTRRTCSWTRRRMSTARTSPGSSPASGTGRAASSAWRRAHGSCR